MRFATVGTSWITEKFISSAKTADNFELTAVYSRSLSKAEAFAEKFNICNIFTDLRTMAESDLFEAVYIASPNLFHYEQSKLFLEHNKNVICEKPATTTKEQMEELIDLAESKGLIYCEAIMTIHTKGFTEIKKRLDSLGNIRSAHFDFYQLSSKYPAFLRGENPNIFNPELHTGCLMDIGVYNLYLAIGLFGMPEGILSDCVSLPNGCDAAGTAVLRYNGCSVVLNYSKTGQTYSKSEIIGDKGTILLSSVSQLTGVSFTDGSVKEEIIAEEVSRDEIMRGEIDFFCRMCESGNYSDKDYVFAKNTALSVRSACDIIRKDCAFLF